MKHITQIVRVRFVADNLCRRSLYSFSSGMNSLKKDDVYIVVQLLKLPITTIDMTSLFVCDNKKTIIVKHYGSYYIISKLNSRVKFALQHQKCNINSRLYNYETYKT